MRTTPALVVFLLIASIGMADEGGPTMEELLAPARMSAEWQSNALFWRQANVDLSLNPASESKPSAISLGNSGVKITGVVVDAVRALPGPSEPNESQSGLWRTVKKVGRTALAVPVIAASLLIPQPMPQPPESGGSYFAWRGSEAVEAERKANQEARKDLLNVRW